MTNTKANTRALQKSKGKAIKGLKAYIKALELAEGNRVSQNKYRYEITEDGSSARIFTVSDNATVEGTDRPLVEWADIGGPARHALIGLRYTKEQLDRTGPRVLYTLNVITQEANITRDGTILEGDEHPTTIDGWAAIGKEIERQQFESMRAAEDYNNTSAVDFVLSNMVRWGIIRSKTRSETKAS